MNLDRRAFHQTFSIATIRRKSIQLSLIGNKCLPQDRAFNVQERLSSTTTLTVDVSDVDDQGPGFVYAGCPLNSRGICLTPTYTANVISGVSTGVLAIHPERIQAIDADLSVASPIRYSLPEGSPEDYREYFEINPTSGWVRQLRPVVTSPSKFELVVRAEEVSDKRRSVNAVLRIQVVPPETAALMTTTKADGVSDNVFIRQKSIRLMADSFEGYVEENSPISTLVTSLRKKGEPLHIKIVDELVNVTYILN